MTDATFIAGLPKAELHMHIEGSIEADALFAMAKRNAIAVRWESANELRAAYTFTNLQAFLNLYYEGCRVLVKQQDFYDITLSYLRRAHGESVVRAEMFISPQAHTARGVSINTVIGGVLGAIAHMRESTDISCGLIVLAQRHLSEDAAMDMFDACRPFFAHILGFGLGGAEVGNPPSKFKRFFARCRAEGFKVTAHAGEEGPAEYVREALDLLKVDRIDHGNGCMTDPELVSRIADLGIPLTVCPLSNLRLNIVAQLKDHPLPAMLQAGLRVTLNSDDPSYFQGYINQNYLECQTALGLSRKQLVVIARNSIEASFAPDNERAEMVMNLNNYASAAGVAVI
jgi:adenosine deaminase